MLLIQPRETLYLNLLLVVAVVKRDTIFQFPLIFGFVSFLRIAPINRIFVDARFPNLRLVIGSLRGRHGATIAVYTTSTSICPPISAEDLELQEIDNIPVRTFMQRTRYDKRVFYF